MSLRRYGNNVLPLLAIVVDRFDNSRQTRQFILYDAYGRDYSSYVDIHRNRVGSRRSLFHTDELACQKIRNEQKQ